MSNYTLLQIQSQLIVHERSSQQRHCNPYARGYKTRRERICECLPFAGQKVGLLCFWYDTREYYWPDKSCSRGIPAPCIPDGTRCGCICCPTFIISWLSHLLVVKSSCTHPIPDKCYKRKYIKKEKQEKKKPKQTYEYHRESKCLGSQATVRLSYP